MKHWWVPGLRIGFEQSFTHLIADLLAAIEKGLPAAPTFREALAIDYVTDAVLQSARSGRWETVRRAS